MRSERVVPAVRWTGLKGNKVKPLVRRVEGIFYILGYRELRHVFTVNKVYTLVRVSEN